MLYILKQAQGIRDMCISKELDQFYTNPTVASECFSILENTLDKIKGYGLRRQYIEPSAGTGSFYNILPKMRPYKGNDGKKYPRRLGFDIDPKIKGINECDFLKEEQSKHALVDYNQRVIIGNPPFGKRSALAIDFFNKASEWAPVIAFIITIQFRKWSVQSKLNSEYELIVDHSLKSDAFIFNGNPYHVNCCFQIWTKKKTKFKNLRLLEKPLTTHSDFEMWQYNNTLSAEKVFENDFDFAVLRQGYGDYSNIVYNENDCDRKKQWILFKAKNDEILTRLKNINFSELANRNTTTPGFGKADVIDIYTSLYNNTLSQVKNLKF